MPSYFDPLLRGLKKPAQYLGDEPYFPLKDWNSAKLRVCLCYPDLYEIGRSHLGLNILCSIINGNPDFLCDLSFAVSTDMEEALRRSSHPLLSLNYHKPLPQFDVLGLSYAYELLATGILQILNLSGIPLRAEDRNFNHPIILGGGPSCGNPEPVAEIFDAMLIGEAEEAILEVLKVILLWKDSKESKDTLYQELCKIEGLYVPLLRNRVKRRIFQGFSAGPSSFIPGVPVIPLSHDRLAIEISRGCTRGCRFCQAGFYYRPVREKGPEVILEEILQGFKRTGYREASLMSLSTGDYTKMKELVHLLAKAFYPRGKGDYAFSLPSLRVGCLTQELLKFLSQGRTTTLTFAVEAGSERLRAVINKDINLEDLFQDVAMALKFGFRRAKIYFMVGLPTEKDADLEEIVRLYRDLKKAFPSLDLTFSASIFIPKPHTPFQWEAQISIDEARERLKFLRGSLKRGFKHHNPLQSFLEGCLARGGRELLTLLEEAFKRGARLDSWKDYFDYSCWGQAAEKLGLDLRDYLAPRPLESNLPWEHIDLGVTKDFLFTELERAKQAKLTKDCRFHKCMKCGVCKQRIKNILANEKVPSGGFQLKGASGMEGPSEDAIWYLLYFTKEDGAKWLSQLDTIRLIELCLRKEGVPIVYTQGFNPHPKMITPQALPVGVASEAEELLISLKGRGWEKKLKGLTLYPGLKIKEVKPFSTEKPKLSEMERAFRITPLREIQLPLLETDDFLIRKEGQGYLLKIWKRDLGLLKLLKDLTRLENPLEFFSIVKVGLL